MKCSPSSLVRMIPSYYDASLSDDEELIDQYLPPSTKYVLHRPSINSAPFAIKHATAI